MKKYIIFLLALPLILSSCLKEDKDVFGQLAGERLSEAQLRLNNILKSAPNGWEMAYYPGRSAEYGGYSCYFKFDGTENVTIASELSILFGETIEDAAKEKESSLYNLAGDYGLTLNLNTYNSLFHAFSEPNTVSGDKNLGLGGDYEFIVMSAESNRIVLRGKKAQFDFVMTPLSGGKTWEQLRLDYYKAVNRMDDGMSSYQLEVNGKAYPMSRNGGTLATERNFTFMLGADNYVDMSFHYTDTGLVLREPIEVDGVSISTFEWKGNEFVDAVTGAKISYVKSNNVLTLTTSDVKATSVKVSVSATVAGDTYYIGAYPKAMEATSTEEEIIAWVANMIASSADLSKGNVERTIRVAEKTEYVACAFGAAVGVSGAVATTKLFKSEPFTTPADVVATDAYKAWLGTWTVTSTSSEITGSKIQLHVTIAENVRNSSYLIYGWDISSAAKVLPGNAKLSGGKLVIACNQTLRAYDDGIAQWMTSCLFDGELPTELINGTFDAFTATLGADKQSAAVVSYKGEYTGPAGGGTFEAVSMTLFKAKGGSYYYLPNASGYTARDFPMGPYTMVKTGNAASIDIKALSHVNYVIDTKVYSTSINYTAL